MSAITNSLKKDLSESLILYYNFLEEGDLLSLSSLMTRESYLLTLETFGFKRAFTDEHFKKLLENIHNDEKALYEIQRILSEDLKEEGRKAGIEVDSYEPKGEGRVTLHYIQDGYPKKMYFSKQGNSWKIDFKAGRKRDS